MIEGRLATNPNFIKEVEASRNEVRKFVGLADLKKEMK